ncbi:MAG: phosphoribosyltransferase family protein [Thermodesulfovibrionales bacterium]
MRLSQQLANLMGTMQLPEDIELITPVPLHKSRLLQRGFNQSANIAYHLAKIKGLPYKHDIIKKTQNTPPQSLMQREERLKNIKGKFEVRDNRSIDGKTILLFDDVVTTSATVNECAKMLKKAGARSVYVLSVARSF